MLELHLTQHPNPHNNCLNNLYLLTTYLSSFGQKQASLRNVYKIKKKNHVIKEVRLLPFNLKYK